MKCLFYAFCVALPMYGMAYCLIKAAEQYAG